MGTTTMTSTQVLDKFKNPVEIGDIIVFSAAYSSSSIDRGEVVSFTPKGNPRVVLFDYFRRGISVTPKAITKEFCKVSDYNNR